MLAGWYVTEVGRQPWVVYGVMRTADAATPHGLGELTLTLALFVAVYLLVFGAGVSYMLRLIRMGPTPAPATPHCPADPANRASRRAPCPPPPPAPACRRKPRIREPEMGIDLALIWAVIILFGIMMYVIMDGFDLGIGILFPLVSDPGERDVMVNTVAPVWDGNETWLVLGGAGLMAAFRWPIPSFCTRCICRWCSCCWA